MARPLGIALSAAILAGCGAGSAVPVSVSQVPSYQIPSFGTESVLTGYSTSSVWFTAKAGPYWQLMALNPQTNLVSDITPSGFSTRGGISAATNGVSLGVMGLFAYQSMLASPIFVTSSAGSNWNSMELPGALDPVNDSLAVSSNHIYALIHPIGNPKRLVVVSETTSASQRVISLPTHLASPSGILGTWSGVVAYRASTPTAAGVAYFYSDSSHRWSSPVTFPKAAILNDFVSVQSVSYRQEQVVECSPKSPSIASILSEPQAQPVASVANSSGKVCANARNGTAALIDRGVVPSSLHGANVESLSDGTAIVYYRDSSSSVQVGISGPTGFTSLSAHINQFLNSVLNQG